MELQTYLARVRTQLDAAAALGDDRAREVAAALAAAAEASVQLALVSALSAAADEITAALLDVPGAPAVSARLVSDAAGSEVQFDVRSEQAAAAAPPEDADASARISLRLGEALKAEIEAAAKADATSVNAWLVRAAAAALSTARSARGARPQYPRDAHRISGWING
jgi:predicted HicB family RNase H-like nuclease